MVLRCVVQRVHIWHLSAFALPLWVVNIRRMALNYIWVGFFALAFVVAVVRLVFFGDMDIFPNMVNSTFASSKTAFEISLGLTGVLSLWMGLMRIGEKGGLIAVLSRMISPLFEKLFPEIPKGHPVMGNLFMNVAANMLGLDNAATPLGLKAMEGLQELNPKKDTASNAMIMFLVLNTSGLTVIPISVMVYRAQLGATMPTDVFIPILIATFVATLAGIISVAIYQRINLFNKAVLFTLGGISLLIAGLTYGIVSLSQADIAVYSSTVANVILFCVILLFVASGVRKKLNVYDVFVEGAKEGFTTAVRIIPYLVAILVAVGVFRAAGCIDFFVQGMVAVVETLGFDGEFVPALPTALMKPLSGSGARGLMIDTMTTYGADSFAGRLSCVFQGATDTTFYILAVYFGSVSVTRTRHAVSCGLIADIAGVIAAVFVCYLFF